MTIETSKDNDKELLKALQDPALQNAAFTLLVKQNSEQLYWQIRRIVLSHDDTDDILQNTFIKAWNNINNFRGDSQLSTWLAQATRLRTARQRRGLYGRTARKRPIFQRQPRRCPSARSRQPPAPQTTHNILPKIFRGNEIRRNIRIIRHKHWRPESLIPYSSKKNRRLHQKKRLNLYNRKKSK